MSPANSDPTETFPLKLGGVLGGALFRDWSKQLDVDVAEIEPGTLIGPYRLLKRVGQGGMGQVFEAERADGEFEFKVALKLIRERGLDRDTVGEWFKRERQLLAQLDHPAIARLIDGGQTDLGTPWFALEWVDGQPLDRWLDTHAPTLRARVEPLLALTDAVAHAHERLVLHGDLKPSNILIDGRGHLKLLDFGIATRLDPVALESNERAIGMTPGIASPEQRAGRALSVRSDVYQLGELMRRVLPNADATLRAVIARATAADPLARYPTVEALKQDLRAWRTHQPTSARADERLHRVALYLRRHALPIGLSALFLLSLAAATIVFIQRVTAERDRAASEAARANEVARFLQTLLGEGDPRRGGQRNDTVTQVLDQAARSIGERFDTQPELKARLQALLAEVLSAREDHDRAASLITAALADPSALPALDRARLKRIEARAWLTPGRFNEARVAIAAARDELKRAATGPDRDREGFLIDRVESLAKYFAGNVNDAVRLQRITINAVETRFGAVAEELLVHLTTLGQLVGVQGDFEEGEAMLSRAYSIAKTAHGLEHAATINAGGALVQVAGARKNFALAEATIDEIYPAAIKVFGAGSPNDALLNMARADLYERRHHCEIAIPLYQQTLKMWDAMPPANDINSVGTLQGLGDCQMRAGRFDEALATYQQMLERESRGKHASDINLGQRDIKVVNALISLGRCDDITEPLNATRERAKKAPPEHPIHRQIEQVVKRCAT